MDSPIISKQCTRLPNTPTDVPKPKTHIAICGGMLTFGDLGTSAFALKSLPIPFVWIWLAWATALFAGVFCLNRRWHRALLFNSGVVAVALAGTEAYLAFHQTEGPTYSEGYSVKDDVLGSARLGIGNRTRGDPPQPNWSTT